MYSAPKSAKKAPKIRHTTIFYQKVVNCSILQWLEKFQKMFIFRLRGIRATTRNHIRSDTFLLVESTELLIVERALWVKFV